MIVINGMIKKLKRVVITNRGSMLIIKLNGKDPVRFGRLIDAGFLLLPDAEIGFFGVEPEAGEGLARGSGEGRLNERGGR